MYKIIDGNKACADMAYLFSEIASIYPITPSSPMANEVDALANEGVKNLFNDRVHVEEMQSEAGAAGALHGALLSGSLGTTFTASQGLLLMIPNMYKMAGECLPAVIHVAARTIATHALSIFGDHSDVYAARSTGFCMLASTNANDANHLAAVAHLSAIDGSLPFLHFFDGFRTSHEVIKVNELEREDVLKLINYDKINDFKSRMLNVGHNIQKGMAENEDIYFQSVEARNNLYDAMPDIVADNMVKINALAGTSYQPFNYYGNQEAENVIVAMGSVCDTIKLVIDDLVAKGESIGLLEVHLYRPFSKKYFDLALPITTKRIAVLDRAKEAGGIGEPLYLDVCSVLKGKNIEIVGGRYGLASKNTTPDQIYSVYEMLKGELKESFTIGIDDDVTNLSLPKSNYKLDLGCKEIKIYGFGSDGMVSASKDIIKIIGNSKNMYVQSYNRYDSKKSGGITICNLRLSNLEIKAPFYVENPDIVVITKEAYLFKLTMIDELKDNGILVINTHHDNMDKFLPNNIKKAIKDKNIKLYTIDAERIAADCGIKGKISKIMEMVIFHLLEIDAREEMVSSIEHQFGNKGEDIVNANIKALDDAIANLHQVDEELTINEEILNKNQTIYEVINNMQGDTLSVSSLMNFRDGTFENGLSKYEKRATSTFVPKWNKDNCIGCAQCSIVCPHAVIRPFAVKDKEQGIPFVGQPEYNYIIEVSEADCTSCGLCIKACPGKNGNKALSFGEYDENKAKEAQEYFDNYENPACLAPKSTIKGSQLVRPRFEFSGACAGCGETPYLKLLTQLFEDKLVIANATGCSSIYSGSAPTTPYTIPWANSLFEDNAEFGYGMLLGYNNARNRIANIMTDNKNNVDNETKELFEKWLDNKEDFEITKEVKEKLNPSLIPDELRDLMDYIPARSVWTIGGDGWAYDIGFGGIDHVLSSNQNVNILVLDTEVYSNTGGQSSKSSRVGAVAQFAGFGKKTAKKDLFKIAMSYPDCYVASVSLGANFMQTIKAMNEAEKHNGPSIIIAYCPCIEQGIKGGMVNSSEEEKLAVQCGYVNLMRYNPEEKKLYLDSKEPDFDKYHDFLMNEVRYNSLYKKDDTIAKVLLEEQIENAKERYKYYQELSKKEN